MYTNTTKNSCERGFSNLGGDVFSNVFRALVVFDRIYINSGFRSKMFRCFKIVDRNAEQTVSFIKV
jgi:hypothetical protein